MCVNAEGRTNTRVPVPLIIKVIIFAISLSCYTIPAVSQNTPSSQNNADTLSKGLQIDTVQTSLQQTTTPSVTNSADTVRRADSLLADENAGKVMTNTKLFIYILMSVLGLAMFFFIFVMTLFKTFHKKKSTRQSLLLSWSLFSIVSIIWIFIVWGLVAGFWSIASFMIVMIFLFIISLSMTIIALKTK